LEFSINLRLFHLNLTKSRFSMKFREFLENNMNICSQDVTGDFYNSMTADASAVTRAPPTRHVNYDQNIESGFGFISR